MLDSPQDFGDISTNETSVSSTKSDVDADFESDIKILMDYSLIATGEDAMVFTMHRLVQQIVRTWLEGRGEQEKWKECFISNLNQEFPSGEYETWETCRPLFPHVKSAMSHRPKSQHSLKDWADLLFKGAWYARACGHISESKHMASMSREGRTSSGNVEAEDLSYIHGTWGLGVVHLEAGEWAEAEQLFLLALEYLRTTLGGVDHPETLIVMDYLAITYTFQGRWDEAVQLVVKVVTTRKTVLGAEHRDTLSSTSSLAVLYMFQGRYDEAERLHLQAMEAYKTKLGMDHPRTMLSMNNLAATLSEQGRLDEAEQLQLQVTETRKTKLGMEHPDTLSSMGVLASILWRQSRWHEAEQLEVHVMEARKTKLGVDHPYTLLSMAILARAWDSMGRKAEAIDLLTACVIREQRVLGPSHPDTLHDSETLLEWKTEFADSNVRS
ncbi:hypothetical protein N7452_003630 [Penicillium brevicompactum]|uniref:Kinesin light chain n=1 Tax=Penicillium brevicompactum TaxID=5074 RepID=A0A9W9UKB8_PENBR|nr:hypothetical protein N7452_003630 [Penicillium brevicompactum]